MIEPRNAFKLGLLAIAAVVAAFAVAFALGLRRAPTVDFHTYFDESVQGLEIGAAVKYRGVKVGRVAGIAVAPDRKLVDATLAIDRDTAARLDLAANHLALRTELTVLGITGLKFVDIDVAAPDAPPPPVLGFTPAPHYLPSRPSLLGGLSGDLTNTTRQMPAVVDRVITTLAKLERLLDQADREELPRRLGAVLDGAGASIAEIRHLVAGIDRAGLPERLRRTVDSIDRAAARIDGVVARLDGVDALVASAHRTSESIGELGRSTNDSTAELEDTLRDLGDAARSLRELIDDVDRDPDILVKGRARSRKP
jgi:paraquat-inducible protein B